jgi:hypothetical protein
MLVTADRLGAKDLLLSACVFMGALLAAAGNADAKPSKQLWYTAEVTYTATRGLDGTLVSGTETHTLHQTEQYAWSAVTVREHRHGTEAVLVRRLGRSIGPIAGLFGGVVDSASNSTGADFAWNPTDAPATHCTNTNVALLNTHKLWRARLMLDLSGLTSIAPFPDPATAPTLAWESRWFGNIPDPITGGPNRCRSISSGVYSLMTIAPVWTSDEGAALTKSRRVRLRGRFGAKTFSVISDARYTRIWLWRYELSPTGEFPVNAPATFTGSEKVVITFHRCPGTAPC